MGAALQSPSEVSPETQTEVKIEFPMSAGGSSFGESERSGLCVVFRGLGDGSKKGSVEVVSECFPACVI